MTADQLTITWCETCGAARPDVHLGHRWLCTACAAAEAASHRRHPANRRPTP